MSTNLIRSHHQAPQPPQPLHIPGTGISVQVFYLGTSLHGHHVISLFGLLEEKTVATAPPLTECGHDAPIGDRRDKTLLYFQITSVRWSTRTVVLKEKLIMIKEKYKTKNTLKYSRHTDFWLLWHCLHHKFSCGTRFLLFCLFFVCVGFFFCLKLCLFLVLIPVWDVWVGHSAVAGFKHCI